MIVHKPHLPCGDESPPRTLFRQVVERQPREIQPLPQTLGFPFPPQINAAPPASRPKMNFPAGLPQDCPSYTPLVMLGTSSALATTAALIATAIMAAAMIGAFMIRTLSADAFGWS